MILPGCENDKRLISEDEGEIASRSEHNRFELGVISSNRDEVPNNKNFKKINRTVTSYVREQRFWADDKMYK